MIDSLGLSGNDIDTGVCIFKKYINDCIDYNFINFISESLSLRGKLTNDKEMTMDYDMKRSWAMLKEVTEYFLGIHKEVDLSQVPCRLDLSRAPGRADALSILSRTRAQISEGSFQRRYASQYILNGGQQMKNFIQGIALRKFRGSITDEVINTTVITRAQRNRKTGRVTPEQIDGSAVRVRTEYDMFSVKTPFGDGSLAWQNRSPVEYKNGAVIMEEKNPASLVTVRLNSPNEWIRPTYTSIFGVLDRESIQNKRLVAEVMEEFLNIPMPELQDGIDENEKNGVLKEHIDRSIDRIKADNTNIEQLSPKTLQSATDLALM